jgi:hypothetical protein
MNGAREQARPPAIARMEAKMGSQFATVLLIQFLANRKEGSNDGN